MNQIKAADLTETLQNELFVSTVYGLMLCVKNSPNSIQKLLNFPEAALRLITITTQKQSGANNTVQDINNFEFKTGEFLACTCGIESVKAIELSKRLKSELLTSTLAGLLTHVVDCPELLLELGFTQSMLDMRGECNGSSRLGNRVNSTSQQFGKKQKHINQ